MIINMAWRNTMATNATWRTIMVKMHNIRNAIRNVQFKVDGHDENVLCYAIAFDLFYAGEIQRVEWPAYYDLKDSEDPWQNFDNALVRINDKNRESDWDESELMDVVTDAYCYIQYSGEYEADYEKIENQAKALKTI